MKKIHYDYVKDKKQKERLRYYDDWSNEYHADYSNHHLICHELIK